MLITEVPDDLRGRGIAPPQAAGGFAISLDSAEPWPGGRIQGRVERRGEKRSGRPITVSVRCDAVWLDVAPQLVGQKRFLRLDTYWDLRTRGVPIWIDDLVWRERQEVGELATSNWLYFAIAVPAHPPRAFEGTFVSFRWRVDASRRRPIGHETASLPLLLREEAMLPVVRIETSPLGSWRLLEWKSDEERDSSAGGCSVRYEDRKPGDMPLPGETRQAELARRLK